MAMNPEYRRQHNENLIRLSMGMNMMVMDPDSIREMVESAKKCLYCGEPVFDESKAFCSAECCRKYKAENKMPPSKPNPNKRKKKKRKNKRK